MRRKKKSYGAAELTEFYFRHFSNACTLAAIFKSLILQKGIFYSYILILVLGIVLLITGYSFSWKPLNSFLITVTIVYPVVKFFLSPVFAWIKLVLTILAIIVIGVLGYRVLLTLAFTSGERT